MGNYRKIRIDHKGYAIIGDTNSLTEQTSTLMLHGASLASSRKRYFNVREDLLKYGQPSVAFDFFGHGETGGELKSSSLIDRIEQASNFLNTEYLKSPYNIVGSSMSGYVAIKLSERYPVNNLVLIVPAVYHKKAINLEFNNGFSDLIRQDKSWDETDAWGILENFKGKLLIISAQNDKVIPAEVINKIFSSAKKASKKEIVEIKGSGHSILDFIDDNGLNKMVAEKINEFIS